MTRAQIPYLTTFRRRRPAGSEKDTQSALQKVEALLADPVTDSAADPEAGPDDDQAGEVPFSLDDLAEKLQVKKSTLYATTIPLADGETRTLGEIKDAFRSVDALAKEREAFHVERARHETSQRQLQQEYLAVLGAIPRDVLDRAMTGDVLARAQQARQETEQTEREALLKAIPEWSDPVRVTADRQTMADHVAAFGFTKHDLGNVTDHRLLNYVRHNAIRERDLAAVKAKGPTVKTAVRPKANKTPTAAMEHGRLKAAVTGRRMQPVDAVAQLLKGVGHGGSR